MLNPLLKSRASGFDESLHTVVHLSHRRSSGRHRQNRDADSIGGVPHRLVGNDILPTDTVGNADNLRTDTMGVLAIAEMGKQLGEVADTLSDRTFLWRHAILCGLLRTVAV